MKDSRMAFNRHMEQVRAQGDANGALITADDTRRRRRIGPLAGVAAASVVAVIGLWSMRPGDQNGPIAGAPTSTTAGTPVSTTVAPTTVATTMPTVSTTVAVAPPDPVFVPAGPIATHRVVGVRHDDVLNVRHTPGADGVLFAELAPTYAGVRATGRSEQVDDGGRWLEVELLQPTELFGLGEPLHGGPAIGWANAAFLEELDDGNPVSFERRVCTLEGGASSAIPGGGIGDFPADHVFAVDHASGPGCERVVVTFGTGFDGFFRFEGTSARPSDHVPAGAIVDGTRFGVGFAGVHNALQTEVATPHGPVLIVGGVDGVSVVFSFPVEDASAAMLGDEGRVVIDYLPSGLAADTTDGLVVVHGTQGADPGTYVVDASAPFDVVGWGRPFESTLGIMVTDENGAPVDVEFSGNDYLGDVTASEYFVTTSASVEGWGSFDFTIGGLPPGSYDVFLFSGGADIPTGIHVPVEVRG